MDIVEHRDGHGYTLAITRSLDLTNCNDLQRALEGLFAQTQEPVWLDVAGLQSVDSAGLALFLKWHRKALAENRRFALVRLTEFHLKLLEITRLDQELVIFDRPGGRRVPVRRAAATRHT